NGKSLGQFPNQLPKNGPAEIPETWAGLLGKALQEPRCLPKGILVVLHKTPLVFPRLQDMGPVSIQFLVKGKYAHRTAQTIGKLPGIPEFLAELMMDGGCLGTENGGKARKIPIVRRAPFPTSPSRCGSQDPLSNIKVRVEGDPPEILFGLPRGIRIDDPVKRIPARQVIAKVRYDIFKLSEFRPLGRGRPRIDLGVAIGPVSGIVLGKYEAQLIAGKQQQLGLQALIVQGVGMFFGSLVEQGPIPMGPAKG